MMDVSKSVALLRLLSVVAIGQFINRVWIRNIAVFNFLNQRQVVLIRALFVALLEILISLIQAYVFTTLSAVFISMSISEEH